MSTEIPTPVLRYLEEVEGGAHRACRDQLALCSYLRQVFAAEDLVVEEKRLAHYLKLARYWPFEQLFPWEEAVIALWLCTYKPNGFPRWRTCFEMTGRGTGKDAFMAYAANCLLSPYNPVPDYDVDVVALNEEQALRPVHDLVKVLDGKHKEKLGRYFAHSANLVQGVKNGGIFQGYTNAPKGRDGLRSGLVLFNEVHGYTNYANIKVFTSGQGKKGDPRRGFFTSNGEVSDGPLDDYLARAQRILFEGEADRGFLPLVFRLDSQEDVYDEANWYKANPSLAYSPVLLEETRDEFGDWLDNPEENGDFLVKRMGIRAGFTEISVTDYEKVLATNQPLPDLTGWSCTVGIDYAELSDWAGVNLHFRKGNDRFDINHAWICAKSKTLPRVKAPWRAWAEAGLVTVVEEVSIRPELLADYVQQMGRSYNLKVLAMDQYRWTLMATALEKIGWDAKDRSRVKLIRPSDIMRAEPVIQHCFDTGAWHWGDNPVLRWAVNNTKRIRASKKVGSDTGNYYYAKIEGKSRKTDPWMALVASMCVEPALGAGAPARAPMAAVRLG